MLSDTFSDRTVVEAENGKRAIEEFEKNKDKLCCGSAGHHDAGNGWIRRAGIPGGQ